MSDIPEYRIVPIDTRDHKFAAEDYLVGTWIEQQQKAGATSIEPRRVEDVRAAIRLALEFSGAERVHLTDKRA